MTFGERLADGVAEKIGSWIFVSTQTVLIAAWIFLNVSGIWQPDVYPFILLNLLLSLQAAYTGPVLLISANRAAERDRETLRRIDATLRRLVSLEQHLEAELLGTPEEGQPDAAC
jgi:uncharacterized membrane protein